MANLSITNSFTALTKAKASEINTDFSDIATWLNNRDNGTDYWLNMNVTATAANPVTIKSSAAATEIAIDNTALDGDPQLTFKLSGSQKYVIGVDDSDSDALKFATTSITTNIAMQIPAGGGQTLFPVGSLGVPGISFIGDTTSGFYRPAANTVSCISNSALFWSTDTSGIDFYVAGTKTISVLSTGIVPNPTNTVSCGKTGAIFTALWATNGTIQSSVLSTKTNVEALAPDEVKIPKPIYFNRPADKHSAQQLGFAADTLPEECFAVIDDAGTRSTENVYTSSVIGMLCGAARNDYERLGLIEARLAALEGK